jgi:hypothetical protein
MMMTTRMMLSTRTSTVGRHPWLSRSFVGLSGTAHCPSLPTVVRRTVDRHLPTLSSSSWTTTATMTQVRSSSSSSSSTSNNSSSDHKNDDATQEPTKKESLEETIRRMQSNDSNHHHQSSSSSAATGMDDVLRKAREQWSIFSEEVSKTWEELLKSGDRKDINKKVNLQHSHPTDTTEGDQPYTGSVDIMVIDEQEQLTAWERMQRRLAEAPIISGTVVVVVGCGFIVV